jgi:glucosyl-dolichyl phosphate glucuronosyltransferase
LNLSVLIATHNRAGDLRETLRSLAQCRFEGTWELVVADNNSTDDTREVVEAAAATFPAPVRYVHESAVGRSAALNAAIRVAEGTLLVTTDDDVRVDPNWLTAASRGIAQHNCDYVTGKVLPLWEAAPPQWWPAKGGVVWGVLAVLDFGPDPVPLRGRAPIGVNAAFRRSAFERVGLFNTSIGRKAGTLLGQEVREWHLRARAANLQGFYLPDMIVTHVIPRQRLTKRYFRSWFYWHGVSRALLYREHGVDMESPEHTLLDFERVPHIAGIPRYLFRSCGAAALRSASARLSRNPVASFEEELKIWRFLGIVRQRWTDRHEPPGSAGLSARLRAQNASPRRPGQ